MIWLGLVAALPVTSFPPFARVLHTTAVAPASGIFLILLIILWLPIYVARKGRFPFQIKTVLLFLMFALFTIGLSFFRYLPDYKNSSPLKAAVEAIATLGMGVLFFLITSVLPVSQKKINQTLAVVNWGGLAILVWSTIQIVVSFINNDFTDGMRSIQHFFSTTVLFDRRATGFASEPSWLAHQLNLVYLVYWISASINRFSAHSFKVWKFSFENLLLAGGFFVLFATFSRGGLGAFMLVLFFLFILANIRFAKWLIKKWNVKNRVLVGVATGLVMFIVYVGILMAGLFVLSKIDPRMEKVFAFNSAADNPIMKFADNLQFGERVVYWQTGWNIFNDFPLTGVGLGFSGFYFPEYLPDYAWQLPEVNTLTGWGTGLLNIKNLWTRLLAETGIIGFSMFVVFLVIMAYTARDLSKDNNKVRKTIGWMGIFMLITFVLEEFSVDSFALPYYWFSMGLVVAAWRWIKPEVTELNG